MKRLRVISLKYRLVAANFVANLLGVVIITKMIFGGFAMPGPQVVTGIRLLDRIFEPLAFGSILVLTLFYERPIHILIERIFSKQPVEEPLALKARQRLLNYPYFAMGVDIVVWTLGGIIYTLFFWFMDVESPLLLRALFISFNTGLVTVTIVFFFTEHIIQRHLIAILFPYESLVSTPKTLRVKISVRMAMVLLACNLIPLIAVLQAVYLSKGLFPEVAYLMGGFYSALSTNALLFMAGGICVIWFVGLNMTIPFTDIIRALKAIKNGRLDHRIQVRSNDEIGYTGDVINDMMEGLREREHMRQALDLAREVQINLLPKSPPTIPGIDIAGRSIYCDQTGGDYFDFLEFDESTSQSGIGLLVGDVSGHGISSALLMTTARAFLRFRSVMPGTIAETVSDVNRQLTIDSGDSGQFMTLFYLVVDPAKRTIRWVRAGHDPAILYDPTTDTFQSLGGQGPALGIMEESRYEEGQKDDLSDGQILVIGTDGIWEARNPNGEMFEKTPLQEIIRQRHESSAEEILNAIIDRLNRFREGRKAEDDVTLIVVKLDGLLPGNSA